MATEQTPQPLVSLFCCHTRGLTKTMPCSMLYISLIEYSITDNSSLSHRIAGAAGAYCCASAHTSAHLEQSILQKAFLSMSRMT